MATEGQLAWAGSIRSIDGVRREVSIPRPGIRFFIEFRVGKWISRMTETALSGVGLSIADILIPSNARMPVKIYVWAEQDVAFGGTYYVKERLSWPGSWTSGKSTNLWFWRPRDGFLLTIPPSLAAKLSKKIAAHSSQRSANRGIYTGRYVRSLTSKPNPITATKTTIAAHESYNSDTPWTKKLYVPVAGTYESYRHSWSSVRTPGFGKIKKSMLPVNPWSSVYVITNNSQAFRFQDHASTAISIAAWYDYFYDRLTNVVDPFVPSAPVHSTVAADKALNKLISHADLSLDGNLAQDFAQMGQTLDVIVNSTRRISRAIQALHEHNFVEAVKQIWQGTSRKPRFNEGLSIRKPLANNWLELQYGWKPLLSDIDASMRQTARFFADSRPIWKVRGKAGNETVVNFPLTYLTTNTVGSGTVCTTSQTVYGLRYTVADKLKLYLSQTGFTNPINLLWEILPYSFVIDWFLPIGPYLQNLTAFDGLDFVDGYKTQFTRQMVTAAANFAGRRPDTTASDPVLLDVSGTYSREYIIVNRTKLTSFPKANNFPSLKNPISPTHAANGLALLNNVFSIYR